VDYSLGTPLWGTGYGLPGRSGGIHVILSDLASVDGLDTDLWVARKRAIKIKIRWQFAKQISV
jgi:hypothetical protein